MQISWNSESYVRALVVVLSSRVSYIYPISGIDITLRAMIGVSEAQRNAVFIFHSSGICTAGILDNYTCCSFYPAFSLRYPFLSKSFCLCIFFYILFAVETLFLLYVLFFGSISSLAVTVLVLLSANIENPGFALGNRDAVFYSVFHLPYVKSYLSCHYHCMPAPEKPWEPRTLPETDS